jgi:hypothetical protein
LFRQRRDNLLAVPGSLLVQDVLADALADVPVEADKRRVDRPGGLLAGGLDQGADVTQQPVGVDLRHGEAGRRVS